MNRSAEDYLEAVLVLCRKTGYVRSVDLARHMGYSRASVSHAVKKLRAGGYLVMEEDGQLRLTRTGEAAAEKIYERRRFFTRQLMDAGVDRETAERDACQIEHAISEGAFQKLKEYVSGSRQDSDTPV